MLYEYGEAERNDIDKEKPKQSKKNLSHHKYHTN
jgi:hypothetical protein